MAQIRSRNTKPEVIVAKYLFARGLRYRKNVKALPGCPDLVFPKYKTVVFVNGCFWHMHNGCKYFALPQSNTEFWEKKLNDNRLRDENNQKMLRLLGWNIIIVWECEIKKSNRVMTLERLENNIRLNLNVNPMYHE